MWQNNKYIYSPQTLRAIAEVYQDIYEGLPLSWNYEVINPFSLAEYKTDFDRALSAIGKKDWGEFYSFDFKDYRPYGRLQRIVIADMLELKDYELEMWGFRDVPRAKGLAYKWMANILNGRPLWGDENRFKPRE